MSGGIRIREAKGDYRAKATRGVAVASVMLMLPFTLYALYGEFYVVGAGGSFITVVLIINTYPCCPWA